MENVESVEVEENPTFLTPLCKSSVEPSVLSQRSVLSVELCVNVEGKALKQL